MVRWIGGVEPSRTLRPIFHQKNVLPVAQGDPHGATPVTTMTMKPTICHGRSLADMSAARVRRLPHPTSRRSIISTNPKNTQSEMTCTVRSAENP